MLNNGRILYERWEYADIAHAFSRLLFHANPDGSRQMEYYGSNSFWPTAMFYARPVPDHPTKVVAVVGGHHGVHREGELVILDPALGRHEAFEVVFSSADDGEFLVSDVELNGADFDWIKFYLGDTEVGVVFQAGTGAIVAEVSDGDVMGCVAPAATVIECSYDRTWLFDSTSDMKTYAGTTTEITPDDVVAADAITIEQILATARHTQAISDTDDLTAAFAASDEIRELGSGPGQLIQHSALYRLLRPRIVVLRAKLGGWEARNLIGMASDWYHDEAVLERILLRLYKIDVA